MRRRHRQTRIGQGLVKRVHFVAEQAHGLRLAVTHTAKLRHRTGEIRHQWTLHRIQLYTHRYWHRGCPASGRRKH